ncbi:hypothetical protein [uncultured Tateyamaria sp.]|uniref:hypothetical protein n=1 Tax=uncultured Tateyamaria sp. TaxID=455651 RepID=UPI002601F98D|nr:hypothetical protein [uncultured Tateyamaria sp.]
MINPKDIANRVKRAIPKVELPSIGREVKLPVYVVHNSSDPEDYFFIFDFEQFVEQTRNGVFVRPALTVWAGRSDFGRSAFATQFRESFAREFDIARAQLAARDAKPRGWFGFLTGTFSELRGASLSAFLANLVLLVATSAGTKILTQVLPARWFAGKSDASKLEDSIEDTQTKVDTALAHLEIRLHSELYDHAFCDGTRGKRADLEFDAWPLPAYVRQHLNDGKSGAWW